MLWYQQEQVSICLLQEGNKQFYTLCQTQRRLWQVCLSQSDVPKQPHHQPSSKTIMLGSDYCDKPQSLPVLLLVMSKRSILREIFFYQCCFSYVYSLSKRNTQRQIFWETCSELSIECVYWVHRFKNDSTPFPMHYQSILHWLSMN